jgi:hypothetical protein
LISGKILGMMLVEKPGPEHEKPTIPVQGQGEIHF